MLHLLTPVESSWKLLLPSQFDHRTIKSLKTGALSGTFHDWCPFSVIARTRLIQQMLGDPPLIQLLLKEQMVAAIILLCS